MPSCMGSETSPSQKTTIIFDWDDTLLASTFLFSNGYRVDTEILPEDLCSQLRELETAVCGVLQTARQFGDVCVITNAEIGWVQLSAQKFLPGVVPLLRDLKIISARSKYEPIHPAINPDSQVQWKTLAFQHRLSGFLTDSSDMYGECEVGGGGLRTVISFGDSYVEREAVLSVTRGFRNTHTKSIKFADRPSMEQLCRQIDLVTNCFAYIHHFHGNLDLQLALDSPSSPSSSPIHSSASPSSCSSSSAAASSSSLPSSGSSSSHHHHHNQPIKC